MKRFLFLLVIFSISTPLLLGQNTSLTDLLDQIKADLPTIEDDKSTIEQSLSYQTDAPYRVTFERVETDKRGAETFTFEMNLAFLNERMVRWESTRQDMYVGISANDDLIKAYKQGELDGYTDELTIFCQDVDQARALEELLKQAIRQAQAAWEAEGIVPTDFEGLQSYIQEALSREVTAGDETYVQTLQPEEGSISRYTFSRRLISEKGQEEDLLFTFDFADIHPEGINIEIKGDQIYLELPSVDKNKYIRLLEEDETDFENALEAYVSTYEDASTLQAALRSFISSSKERFQERLPDLETQEEAINYLEEQIQSFEFNGRSITQSIAGGCFMELSQTIAEEDEQTEYRFLIDAADLAANAIDFDISSKGIQVVPNTTDKVDFVGVYEDGEQENYDSDFPIYVPTIPSAKRLRHAISRAAATCRNEIELKDFAWMVQEVEKAPADPEVTTRLQSEEPCKWVFTITEEGRRGQDIERYEFNLSDLNDKSVELGTRGTEASVTLGTNYQERVIAVYDEEEEVEYQNEVVFPVSSIRAGKAFIGTIMQAIAGCKE
jgi:hypothetical protein